THMSSSMAKNTRTFLLISALKRSETKGLRFAPRLDSRKKQTWSSHPDCWLRTLSSCSFPRFLSATLFSFHINRFRRTDEPFALAQQRYLRPPLFSNHSQCWRRTRRGSAAGQRRTKFNPH